ncbi:outer membrane beta-barrel protein [Gramella sp. MAR_2010_147]|uniref:outer membrane beta-barrel protein n=1 Tax=Gramella sp. MAR_2010_147 TaxID=1250205 RepID=UPI00087AC637|nr:outer membrane beta-barrel protein [Gramella sp. MAR_2010_147]SDR90956.1 Outer membrane protein beta-barrel domain-containing protein [Gramella sp. MAR_2010_147]
MFKKLSLIALFAIMTYSVNAQETQHEVKYSKFGFTSGIITSKFDLANVGQIKEKYNPGDHDGNGIYLGLTFDTGFNKNFGLNSELIYAKLDESDRYLLSTSLKYRLFNSDFHMLGGLELNYLGSNPKNALGEENVKRAGLNGLLGLEYQFNDRFSIYGNFSTEVTNRLKDDDGDTNHGYHNGRLGVKFKL